jgi:hypothetical protein
MRDLPSVRRTAPGEWTVVRPRIGFGPPETHTASTAAAAWRWLRNIERPGSHGLTERARNVATGVGSIPRWERRRFPYQP